MKTFADGLVLGLTVGSVAGLIMGLYIAWPALRYVHNQMLDAKRQIDNEERGE